ncbi:MAG: hypothetical protein AVDCRST_MAG49-2903, partial [uncultured Thermomicrobiales bacterium]
ETRWMPPVDKPGRRADGDSAAGRGRSPGRPVERARRRGPGCHARRLAGGDAGRRPALLGGARRRLARRRLRRHRPRGPRDRRRGRRLAVGGGRDKVGVRNDVRLPRRRGRRRRDRHGHVGGRPGDRRRRGRPPPPCGRGVVAAGERRLRHRFDRRHRGADRSLSPPRGDDPCAGRERRAGRRRARDRRARRSDGARRGRVPLGLVATGTPGGQLRPGGPRAGRRGAAGAGPHRLRGRHRLRLGRARAGRGWWPGSARRECAGRRGGRRYPGGPPGLPGPPDAV